MSKLSNYGTKTDLINGTGVDTSNFSNVDLASLKAEVDKLDVVKLKNVPTNLSSLKIKTDKLDIDKLVPVPVDLSKLSNVVKNDFVKKDVYNAKFRNIEDKILDITNLATKITRNAKINEVKGEISSFTNLATTTALTAVENKIPNDSDLVKEADYNTKVNEIEKKITDNNHDKYITTPEHSKVTAENFAAKLAQANLVTKTGFNNKLINLNKKINSNKTKYLLVENEFKKLDI